MERKPQPDDELIIDLVDQAMAQPTDRREAYLESVCGGNTEAFEQAWHYVQVEERMDGFLLRPLFPIPGNETPFEPAQLLDGRFRIVRELARGGMGIVYEAVDEKLDRRIAIKCAKAGFRKRLPPEVRHASEISHPNVCKIFEIHTAETRQGPIDFLTMEFLDGETLADRLRRGSVPDAEARVIAEQLCAGLAEAHRNHVIHGDLKSCNVILTAESDGTLRAVITDFGLARTSAMAGRTVQSGERGGTPDYMAPELWRGEKASVASDLYALGVILYELAAGRRPFGQDIPLEHRLALCPQPLGPKWDRAIAPCLRPDPARRFQNAGEVAQALAPRSRRWWFAAAAAAVLAIASAAVTYERATAPPQTVRLAVLPFGPADLSRDTAVQLARLRGDSHTGLKAIPLNSKVSTVQAARALLGATHVLQATVEHENDDVILNVHLTDASSGLDVKDEKVRYRPAELRYAPAALAGFVTSALGLPPLVAKGTVNAAALEDYRTGLSYVRDNIRLDEAVTLLERAVASDPDSALTYAGLAEAQMARARATGEPALRDQARESLREAQLRNPDLAEVHLTSGLINFSSSLNELAEADYLRTIALEPRNGTAYRRLSSVYERNAHPNEALAAAHRAVEIEPGLLISRQVLASIYFQRGEYRDALPEYRKAVEMAPKSWATHNALGADLGALGQFDEAERELQEAIGLKDGFDTEFMLGSVLLDAGKSDAAIACFLKAEAIGPVTGLLWLNLGLAYSREHLEAKAKAAFLAGLAFSTKYLERDSRDSEEHARQAYFEASLGYEGQAESNISQVLQLKKNNVEVLLIALLTFESLRHSDRGLELLADSPPALRHSLIIEADRYPELAGLRQQPRYRSLVDSK
jgi:tetratricopeptide (TPR) repeat protein